MQVSVETTNGLERKITVVIEEERLSSVIDGLAALFSSG